MVASARQWSVGSRGVGGAAALTRVEVALQLRRGPPQALLLAGARRTLRASRALIEHVVIKRQQVFAPVEEGWKVGSKPRAAPALGMRRIHVARYEPREEGEDRDGREEKEAHAWRLRSVAVPAKWGRS